MSVEDQNLVPLHKDLIEDDQLKRLFIGDKYDSYYKAKFDEMTPKKQMAGFNFGSFFFGPVWLFYRKMYVYALIYIAFMFVFGMIITIFELPEAFDRGGSIGIAVSMGFIGNTLYKSFVEKKIKMIVSDSPPTVEEQLKQKGGTNIIAALLFVVVMIILIMLSI